MPLTGNYLLVFKSKGLHDHKLILNKHLRKTKREYFENQFVTFSNVAKNTWKLLHQITGPKTQKSDPPMYFKNKIGQQNAKCEEIIITDDNKIANEFNNDFANVDRKVPFSRDVAGTRFLQRCI